ncbi:pentapeptide repeat-containing protein [Bacillus sp. sid0103]|nr:pentapeptide repeat-containing protein [Bacillus sp. sid0103]
MNLSETTVKYIDLLLEKSEYIRTELSSKVFAIFAIKKGKNCSGFDRIGKNLAGKDLRTTDLRGSYLIVADLRNIDLRGVDFIRTDLHVANISGANLSTSMFLTQMQINSVKSNDKTILPSHILIMFIGLITAEFTEHLDI